MMPLPNFLRNTFLAVIPLGLLMVLTTPVAASELQDLRVAWKSAQTIQGYADVTPKLIEFRIKMRYARTAEVDYMIATSLCRMPGRKPDGARHFDWILASYDLGDDRKNVLEEKDRCAQSRRPLEVAFAMLPGQGGTSEIRSKMYYWIGREDAAINTEPVKIVSAKTPQELRSRLYDVSALEDATSATGRRVGAGFTVVGSGRFVIASSSGHTSGQLRGIADKLEKFMSFYIEAYRLRAPTHLLTVYLTPDMYQMAMLATKLHGIEIPGQSIGYAFRDDLSVLAVIPGEAIGTLAHELFHVLVRDRYGDLPPWLDEGTASLYEVSNVSAKYVPGGHQETWARAAPTVAGELAVRGTPNWRGCVLKKLWLEKRAGNNVKRPALDELIAMDWSVFNNWVGDELVVQQAVNHAVARYFVLYLQDEQKKLFTVFADFAGRDPFAITNSPAVDARIRLAKTLGDLSQADARFEAWLRAILPNQNCN